MTNRREPLAVCFGGGGAFGIGFNMGVADGMTEDGVDVRAVALMGTSAGSYAAAALAAGISFHRLADDWAAYTASLPRSFWVRTADLTEAVFGTATAPGVSTVALRLLTLRRTVLAGDCYRLSDLVAASSSPVPWARPHRIGRRRYLDGGLRRMASADLTPRRRAAARDALRLSGSGTRGPRRRPSGPQGDCTMEAGDGRRGAPRRAVRGDAGAPRQGDGGHERHGRRPQGLRAVVANRPGDGSLAAARPSRRGRATGGSIAPARYGAGQYRARSCFL
jgi:predicted acylesterase/phospholipase RssA